MSPPAQRHGYGDTQNATTRRTHPYRHYSRFTHHVLQVVEQEQGDNASAQGVCHCGGARDHGTRTGTGNKHVRGANRTPTPAAGNVGAPIAVRFADSDRVANRVSVADQP